MEYINCIENAWGNSEEPTTGSTQEWFARRSVQAVPSRTFPTPGTAQHVPHAVPVSLPLQATHSAFLKPSAASSWNVTLPAAPVIRPTVGWHKSWSVAAEFIDK